MNGSLLLYAPGAAKNDHGRWRGLLPGFLVAASETELLAALAAGAKRGAGGVCVLLPGNMAELASLTLLAENFHGWRVIVELPENSQASLRLARPLAPRFFTFRDEGREYLFEVARWMAREAPGLKAAPDSDSAADGRFGVNSTRKG